MAEHDFPVEPKTQRKLERCARILNAIPDEFVTYEVKDILGKLEIGDWRRFLFMLANGGFISRTPDKYNKKRFIYQKTALALGDENKILATLMERRTLLIDYEQSSAKKRSQIEEVDIGPFMEIPSEFYDVINKWKKAKAVLPQITLRQFLELYTKSME